MKVISYPEREKFILDYITNGSGRVDILNLPFLDAYCKHTNAKFSYTMWGANKCPMLGKDLAKMYQSGLLIRARCGIEDARINGFPTWVWMYTKKGESYDR